MFRHYKIIITTAKMSLCQSLDFFFFCTEVSFFAIMSLNVPLCECVKVLPLHLYLCSEKSIGFIAPTFISYAESTEHPECDLFCHTNIQADTFLSSFFFSVDIVRVRKVSNLHAI